MVYNLENFLDMTTLIWEGDLFYDVHLISPAKFWKRSTIPLDVFVDFWNIVVEPDEELKKKTKRKKKKTKSCPDVRASSRGTGRQDQWSVIRSQ